MRFRILAVIWLCLVGDAAVAGEITWLREDWRQGGVVIGSAAPETRVWFKGVELARTAQGEFIFGLDRDEGKEVWIKTQRADGAPVSQRHPISPRNWDIQRINGLPPSKVEPPAGAMTRIAEDQRQIKAARQIRSQLTGFRQPFIWAAQGRISGVFGSQRILNGTPKQPHNGVDVAVPEGTEIVAPADGIVTLAVPDMYFTGGTVMIDHGHGLSSIMVHMSKLIAQPGQAVKQGEVVALSGMTGRATGPHLHWGMSWLGVRIDPQSLLPPMPTN